MTYMLFLLMQPQAFYAIGLACNGQKNILPCATENLGSFMIWFSWRIRSWKLLFGSSLEPFVSDLFPINVFLMFEMDAADSWIFNGYFKFLLMNSVSWDQTRQKEWQLFGAPKFQRLTFFDNRHKHHNQAVKMNPAWNRSAVWRPSGIKLCCVAEMRPQ